MVATELVVVAMTVVEATIGAAVGASGAALESSDGGAESFRCVIWDAVGRNHYIRSMMVVLSSLSVGHPSNSSRCLCAGMDRLCMTTHERKAHEEELQKISEHEARECVSGTIACQEGKRGEAYHRMISGHIGGMARTRGILALYIFWSSASSSSFIRRRVACGGERNVLHGTGWSYF